MSDFNKNLRFIREKMGLSCTEMANRLGIKPSTFSYYLKDREPSYDTLIRIANEFNVSVSWLLGFKDIDKEELRKENAELRLKLGRIRELLINKEEE